MEASKIKERAKKKTEASRASLADHGSPPEHHADRGRLQPIASRILMKILWAARLARFDLLRAVSHLATFVTK